MITNVCYLLHRRRLKKKLKIQMTFYDKLNTYAILTLRFETLAIDKYIV